MFLLFVRSNESSVVNNAFSLRSFLSDDLVTFSFLRKSNKTQYIVHTHNRHVSRTDKQHLSRPQTTTSTRSGYTTGQSNQQCDLFQEGVQVSRAKTRLGAVGGRRSIIYSMLTNRTLFCFGRNNLTVPK